MTAEAKRIQRISENIAKLIQLRGAHRVNIAKAVGISYAYYKKCEADPGLLTLHQLNSLAAALGVSYDTLMNEEVHIGIIGYDEQEMTNERTIDAYINRFRA